jgi:glutamate:GABA antiporter
LLYTGQTLMSGPPPLRRELGLRDLVLFNVAVVAGVRGFSGAAQAGAAALPLFALCVALFFIPMAILVAGLGRRFPVEGGFYVWIREAFDERAAFLCAWIYAIGILGFFPTLLVFGASVVPHVLGAGFAPLADRPGFVLPITLAILWSVTFANIAGLRFAKWINNIGGLCTSAAFVLLVGAAIFSAQAAGSATQFEWRIAGGIQTLVVWAQMMYLLTGLELGGVMAGEIRNPQRTVALAALIGGAAITLFYVAGTGALLAILPASAIDPVYGATQAASRAAALTGAAWLPIVFAAIIVASVIGQFGAVLCSASRLPWILGLNSYLPEAFSRTHPRFGTPHVSMLVGAAVSSLFLVAMFSGETLHAGFNALYDATILLNSVPFLVMFGAGWRLGYRISSGLGFAVSLTALGSCLVPPPGTNSAAAFEAKILGGLACALVSGWWLHRRQQRVHSAAII